ncbi:MAG: Na/Pi symporter [Candidatus Eisenbacteria bacterium]
MPEHPGSPAPQFPGQSRDDPWKTLVRVLTAAASLYVFLLSVNLLGSGFKMFGAGFAEQLIATTSNPFVGLFIGILATSIVQSSSMTTSMTVGFVASGVLTLEGAVPIIMGANIGTTVTCAIVSMGHIGRKEEFRRAFAAASVHDFFNVMAVLILFPLELATGFLSKSAGALSRLLVGGEAISFASPVKQAVGPLVESIGHLAESVAGERAAILVVIVALVLLFGSLYVLVKRTKALALGRAEVIIDRFMGRSGLAGMAVGAGITAVIQSSSVTTSLLVPLAGAGIVKLEKVFPVTLGANIGTTITALLASLAGDSRGLTIALVHLLFNIAGIIVIYPYKPIRKIPLTLARKLADAAVRSRRNAIFFVIGLFYALPAVLILMDRWF